jgi:hypothetical protein
MKQLVAPEPIYTPHTGVDNPEKGQEYLHSVQANVKVLEVARRWGKGRWALFDMLDNYQEALRIPVPPSLVPPWHAWIVVPSTPQATQIWNELLSFIPKSWYNRSDVHMDDMSIKLQGNGNRAWGFIEVKSAYDPESLQSVGLDYLWVSEAADISNAAFYKLLPAMRSSGRMGRAVFEGIPAMWPDHWFRLCYLQAERGDREGWFAFKATYLDNPMLTRGQIKDIEKDRELMPDRAWRRMYLAEFSESSGYFSNMDACIAGDIQPEPIPGGRYVGGLDLGRKIDASVLTIFDAAERRVVHHRTYDAGQNWVVQRESVHRIFEEWNLQRLVVDATSLGGDIFTQELTDMGVPVEPFQITARSRDELLTGLAVSLERQTITFPPVPSLLRQLRAFQYRKLPGGSFRVEAPPGEHDDEVFALALGLTACDMAPEVQRGLLNRRTRRRYIPTADEVYRGDSSGKSQGAQMMKQRQSDKMKERLEKII